MTDSLPYNKNNNWDEVINLRAGCGSLFIFMPTKVVKSRGPGKRVAVLIDYKKTLTVDAPRRQLLTAIKKAVGRNVYGRITTRWRSAPSHRRLYRIVDFSRRDKLGIPAEVKTIEYDPGRNAFIMLVCYADGDWRYHLAPDQITVGQKIVCQEQAPAKLGNRLALKNIIAGTEVSEVELTPASGGKFARAAGSAAIVLGCDEKYCSLKMSSKEVRKVSKECFATIGRVSNPDYQNVRIGKAGRNRWKGLRPKVRASAMNPVDHPYGGGEGRTQRGTKRPKTKWGKVTGGRKTRNPRKPYGRLIVARRKK